jgi:hypothetical protein
MSSPLAPTSLDLNHVEPYPIDFLRPFNGYSQLNAPVLEYELLATLDKNFAMQNRYSTAALSNMVYQTNPTVFSAETMMCDEIARGCEMMVGGDTTVNPFVGGRSQSVGLSDSVVRNQRLIPNQTVTKSEKYAPGGTLVQGKLLVQNERLNQSQCDAGQNTNLQSSPTHITIPVPMGRKVSVKKDTRSLMVGRLGEPV